MTLRPAILLAVLAIASPAAADQETESPPRAVGGARPSESRPARAREPVTRAPQGPQRVASVPPVTRAEADAVLAALVDAYAREDESSVEKLHSPVNLFSFKARRDARKLFSERNHVSISFEVQSEHRVSDGALAVVAVVRRSSQVATEREPRRDKFRLTMEFTRLPGGPVVLATQVPAEAGLLPQDVPWRNASLSGTVRLEGAGTSRRSIDVDVSLDLRNVSDHPAAEVAFALHPYSSDLVATLGASPLEAQRTEASLDAWRVELPAAVEPGGPAQVRLRYRLEQPGAVAASEIEPDLVRLYGQSAWLPIVEPIRTDPVPERNHDLVVVAPDGIATSMPGRRSEEPSPGPGLHAERFVSEVPGVETPLVAVRGTLEAHRLGPSLVLDVLRAEGGGDPARAISYVTTLAAFLEDRLMPCPVTRLALAESVDGGFKESPGWMALPTLAVSPDDPELDENDQVFLFTGLSMARLWIVHARAPSGVGARNVALGLCEHLVSAWAGATIRKDIPRRQRELILSYVQLDPQLDRPLLPVVEETGTPRIFKQDKAHMAFDGYELLVGAERWRDVLASWVKETQRGARIETLLDRMGGTPERDAYVDAFFRRQGACQVSIADMRLVPLTAEEAAREGLDPDAWKRVEIEVDNSGIGPVPVQVQVQIDGGLQVAQVTVPQAGRAVATFLAGRLPSRVRLDPDAVLWQSRSDDDVFPAFKRKTREEFEGGVVQGRHGLENSGDVRRDPRP